MRLRGHVLDAEDLEAGGLERPDRGLAPGARALHEDLDLLQAVLHALAGARVGGHLRGERRRLARALEAGRAGRLPDDHVALGVGERDDRVVERRLDVRLADGDVLTDAAPRAAASRLSAQEAPLQVLLGAFLPRPTVFFGPFRVRAFVFVRWPFTGRPRRWRMPRYAPISPRRLIALLALAAEVALDLEVGVDVVPELRDLAVGEVVHLGVAEIPTPSATLTAVERPIPKMYVARPRAASHAGRLTPAIRAILALPLLVARIGADDHGPPVPADHAASLTHRA